MSASDVRPLNAKTDSEQKNAIMLNLVGSLLILQMKKKSCLIEMLRIASNSEGCRSPSSSENINISKKKGNLQNILNVDYFPSCSLVQGGKYSKLRVCTRCGT